jgi:SAM-dependent methyltransferase
LDFPLLLADAEHVPLPDACFDMAISEYGAATWCDPYVWIPEASRLLRDGGRLVFLNNSALLALCMNDDEDVPAGAHLLRDYFGMHRFEWPDEVGVEFHIPHGEMIRLIRRAGFDVLDLVELQAPEGATTSFGFVDGAWAARWPSEEVWVAQKRAPARRSG